MKKILITTNIITLLFLGLTYFTGCGKAEKLVVDGSLKSTCTPCLGEPYQQVTTDYIGRLINNYRQHHWKAINESSDFVGVVRHGATVGSIGEKYDSRSVWFDLNKLKSFIAEVESITQEKTGDDHCDRNLGVRIYFGEYTKDQLSPETKDYEGLHTLVMVPTIRSRNAADINTVNENIDFDPLHFDAAGEPEPISSQWTFFTALTPEVTSMNHGQLIPPPYPEVTNCTGAKVMHEVDFVSGFTSFRCP